MTFKDSKRAGPVSSARAKVCSMGDARLVVSCSQMRAASKARASVRTAAGAAEGASTRARRMVTVGGIWLKSAPRTQRRVCTAARRAWAGVMSDDRKVSRRGRVDEKLFAKCDLSTHERELEHEMPFVRAAALQE